MVNTAPPTSDFSSHLAEPRFWNEQLKQIPWCVELKNRAEAIRHEVLHFAQTYRPYIPYPKYADLYENTWDAFPLSEFQGEFLELSKANIELPLRPMVDFARGKLPITSGLIQELEQQAVLSNVFVSKLIPGTIINPHKGWTPNYLRIHLCLQADPKCQITVGDEVQTWQVGDLLAFKDGGPYLHSVRHRGHNPRVIVSFDMHLDYVAKFIPEIL